MAGSGTDILEWTGAEDGAWTNSNNWITQSGSPGGNIPAAGEGAYIGENAQRSITSGATSAVTLDNFRMHESARIDVGDNGSALTNVSASTLYYAGRGDKFFINGTFTTAILESAGPGLVSIVGGTQSTLIMSSGRAHVQAGADVQALRNNGGDLTVEAHASEEIDDFVHTKGVTHMKRDFDVCSIAGDMRNSVVKVSGSANNNVDTATNGSVIVQHGGRLLWESNGTINRHTGYSGVLDPRNNPHASFEINERETYRASFMLIDSWGGGGSITDTSGTDFGSESPTFSIGAPPDQI